MKNDLQHVYGPVFSRRLGHSLGVDLVPFKTCTYDCIYCQLGRTTNKTCERKEYVQTAEILAEVAKKLSSGPAPDYISLVGSGEPTLHSHLGELISRIKKLSSVPVAVITNGSLLWKQEVQESLLEADLALPSLDAGDEDLFRHVNRPHEEISFERMVDGLAEFNYRFPGQVWLEVFLLAGVTGIPAEVEKIAAIARRVQPDRIQLNTISRPAAEEFAIPVETNHLEYLKGLLPGKVEVIASPQRTASAALTEKTLSETEILSVLGRHPCSIDDMSSGLGMKMNEVVKAIEKLLNRGEIIGQRSDGKIYYILNRQKSQNAGTAS